MPSKLVPNNSLTQRAQKWKKDQGIISLPLGELQKIAQGKRLIAEQKVDGQSAILSYENGKAQFGSLGGRIITEIPVLADIERSLKKNSIKSLLAVGELAGFENGKIIHFDESESLIKNPAKDKEALHWFFYQALEIDGKEYDEKFDSYLEGWKELNRVLKGSSKAVPVDSYEGSSDVLQKAWDKLVEKEGNEGLVVRLENGKVYKSKPEFTYDLVIVAVGTKKGKNWPKRMIGNTLMAFMDKDHVFRIAGEIGTGYNDEESRELFSWAQKNKVGEDDEYVWVKPERVVECQWERSNIKLYPSYTYERGKYVPQGKKPVGTIVKPRFIRYRKDKSVNPSDLRLTQIPNWEKVQKMAARVIASWSDANEKHPKVTCNVFSDKGNDFTEKWFYKIYNFIEDNLGEFLGNVSGNILPLPEKDIKFGINAKYEHAMGDIFLRKDAEGNVSYLLGNLLHELTHANLGNLYTETFYVEGFADYIDELLSDNDFWGSFRKEMREGYISSNKSREERARKEPTQFNVERWRGQQWARKNLGPSILEAIKRAKKNNFSGQNTQQASEKKVAMKNRVVRAFLKKEAELSGSESLFGFCGWLTSREDPTVMSATDDAGHIAELVDVFCKTNKLSDPRDGWDQELRHPRMAAYPDHPDQIVISKSSHLLGGPEMTELDVYSYYTDGVVTEMLKELKGRDLFIGMKLKDHPGPKPLYIRHPYDKKTDYIRISNEKDFEIYHSGRSVELHVTMPSSCPYFVVDFDAVEDWPTTKKITADIADMLDKLPEVKKVDIRYTGKRGFHVLGWLKKPMPIDKAREALKEHLKEAFGDRKDLVLGESPSGSKGALGVSPMKLNGGQVALWSMRVTGLCCVEVPRASLSGFKREDARPEKVYKKLTGKALVPAREKEAAQRVIQNFLKELS